MINFNSSARRYLYSVSLLHSLFLSLIHMNTCKLSLSLSYTYEHFLFLTLSLCLPHTHTNTFILSLPLSHKNTFSLSPSNTQFCYTYTLSLSFTKQALPLYLTCLLLHTQRLLRYLSTSDKYSIIMQFARQELQDLLQLEGIKTRLTVL